MPDVEGLADDLVTVLIDTGDDHDRSVEVGDPAEPTGEHRSQRVRDRSADVAGRVLGDGSGIHDQRSGRDMPVDGVDIEPLQSRQPRVQAGAAPIQLGEPCEVGRERPEPGQQLLDESVLVLETEQFVAGPLAPQRGGAVGATRC